MHISSRFVIVYSIELVIRMLYHSSETLSLLSFFYLMVKLGKPLFKIGFHFQIALFFLFYRNFYPRPPTLTAYLFGPNVPSPPWIRTPPPPPRLFGTQEYAENCKIFCKIIMHVKYSKPGQL